MSAVSVALAAYNGERFIAEQLQSIADQTLQPSELVIADDGSTDDTLQIIDSFVSRSDVPVKLLRTSERRGVADNFMFAAAHCEADLIAFADQDDVWRPDKLEKCVRPFQDPEVQLAIHAVMIVDDQLRPVGEGQRIRRARVAEPLSVPKWAQYGGMSLVFRRELLRAFDWDSRPRSHREDPLLHDEWIIGVARVMGKIAFVPHTLVYYRQHGANVEGAADVRLRARAAQVATPAATYYGRRAAQSREWATLLDAKAASATDQRLAQRLHAEAHSYLRLAHLLDKRAAVHDPELTAEERLRAMRAAWAAGVYGSRVGGAFGLRGLVRDVALAIAGAVGRDARQPAA